MAIYNPFNPMDAAFAPGSPAPGSMSTIATEPGWFEDSSALGATAASQNSATTQSFLAGQQTIYGTPQQWLPAFQGLASQAGAAQSVTAANSVNFAQQWFDSPRMQEVRIIQQTAMELARRRQEAFEHFMRYGYTKFEEPLKPAERLPFTTKPEVPF